MPVAHVRVTCRNVSKYSSTTRYNLKDMTWQTIVDTVVVGAMGPPGGGRNHITPRLLRHFNILCFLEFDDSTLTRIFKTIVDWHFSLNKVGYHAAMLRSSGHQMQQVYRWKKCMSPDA